MKITIHQATIDDIDVLAILLDGYRQFYQQDSDINAAHQFLSERLQRSESVIFLASDETGKGLGFTQLYPTFSSVSMKKRWILNDLFVAKEARKMGVASQLMHAAEAFVKTSGASGLSLSTAIDNYQAQALYEKCGWKKVTAFCNYNKTT